MEAVTELTDRSQEEQGASDGPILSWSEDEELLSDLLSVPKRGATFSVLPCLAIVVALVASAFEDVRGKSSETSGKPRTKTTRGVAEWARPLRAGQTLCEEP